MELFVWYDALGGRLYGFRREFLGRRLDLGDLVVRFLSHKPVSVNLSLTLWHKKEKKDCNKENSTFTIMELIEHDYTQSKVSILSIRDTED